jgi:Helicase HerA, central domain
MDVQDLCRKLKPLIGIRADRYWLAYLADDARGKRELETALNLLAARLLGSDLENPEVHLSAPPPATAKGAYALGNVAYNGKELHPFGLREEDLIQHTAIFGRSGAGKTNTVMIFLEQLLEKGKPFLIFDWKRNYRDLLAVRNEEIVVFTVGRQTVPFAFNPLIPPEGTDPAVWLKKLIEIIAHSYYLGEGVMFLLQEAIHAVYQENGVYTSAPKQYPTFNDVHRWLEHHPVKGRKALWMDSAIRGIKSICFGHMGNVVNTSVQSNLGEMLEKNVILELDGLTNADKTLITESMLLWTHHYRLAQPDRETFKHALIIEEAHHILRKQTGGHGPEAITETILREIRELGEAILIVDQHPSMISIPALGNTYATITMNLKHSSDVSAIAAAMLMEDDDRDILGRLPIGSAVVKLQGRWPRPFQVRIPLRSIQKGSVDDCSLIQHMTTLGVIVPNQESLVEPEPADAPDKKVTPHELQFLEDVADHPLSGVVQRYKRLGANRRKGNAWKQSCLVKGLIAVAEIATPSGRVVLLELTDAGREMVRTHGHEVPDRPRWGSPEHEYWKHTIAEQLQDAGYEIVIEEPVNGYTDIIARKDGKSYAVEIETGKSDWRANIEKNLKKDFDRIILVPTNDDAQRKIAAGTEIGGHDGRITAIPAQQFVGSQYPDCLDLSKD